MKNAKDYPVTDVPMDNSPQPTIRFINLPIEKIDEWSSPRALAGPGLPAVDVLPGMVQGMAVLVVAVRVKSMAEGVDPFGIDTIVEYNPLHLSFLGEGLSEWVDQLPDTEVDPECAFQWATQFPGHRHLVFPRIRSSEHAFKWASLWPEDRHRIDALERDQSMRQRLGVPEVEQW